MSETGKINNKTQKVTTQSQRVVSIDLIRGAVMILMALVVSWQVNSRIVPKDRQKLLKNLNALRIPNKLR